MLQPTLLRKPLTIAQNVLCARFSLGMWSCLEQLVKRFLLGIADKPGCSDTWEDSLQPRDIEFEEHVRNPVSLWGFDVAEQGHVLRIDDSSPLRRAKAPPWTCTGSVASLFRCFDNAPEKVRAQASPSNLAPDIDRDLSHAAIDLARRNRRNASPGRDPFRSGRDLRQRPPSHGGRAKRSQS